MAIQDRLVQDINRWLHITSEEKGPLRKVELIHISREANTGRGVVEWPIKEEKKDIDVPTLVAQILETAQADANGWGDVQQYVIAGYFKDDNRDGGRSVVFAITGERSLQGPGERGLMPTEPMTEKGLAAVATRHSEALHRMLCSGFAGMIENQGRTIEKLSNLVDHLMERHVQIVTQSEELLDRKAERDVMNLRENVKARNLERIMDTVVPILPTIVNKVVGFRILPENVAPELEQVRLLLGSLNQEQLGKIAEALEPTQSIAFLDFYERMRMQPGGSSSKPKELPAIPKA